MVLRELFTRLGLQTDSASFAEGNAAVELVKAGLEKLAEFAHEAVEKFVELIKATAEQAEQLKDMAQRVGVSTDSLQRMGRAASLEGMNVERLGHHLTLLARSLVAARSGTGEFAEAFRRVGVATKDAQGHVRNVDEVFKDLIGKFSTLPDSAEKSATALKLFGRGGSEMIPLLNLGAEAIEEMEAAVIVSPEQLAAGKELVVLQRRLAIETMLLWRSAIAPLLPAISEMLKGYLAWRKANVEIVRQGIARVLGTIVKAVGVLGKAMMTTLDVINDAVGVLAHTWKVVLVMMTAALAPFIVELVAAGIAATGTALGMAVAWTLAAAPFVAIGAAIAGVLLLLDDIEGYKSGKDSLFGRYKKMIDSWMAPQSTDPWWLTAIKALVMWMEKALGVASDLGLAGGAATPLRPGMMPEGGNGSTRLSVPARIDKWLGRGPFASGPEGGPSIPPAGGVGTVLAPSIHVGSVQFNTTTQPGQEPAAFAKAQRVEWDDWFNEKLEAAHAAVPGS